MITIDNVVNPQWSNKDHTLIDMTVKFSHLPVPVLFTASATDCMDYGRSLFDNARDGIYGPVSDYTGE